MIINILSVAFGGGLGAVLRYLIFFYFERFHKSIFPWPTLIVNLLGALLIGLLWGYFDKIYVSPGFRMFIFIGILGSFTTFSTFAFDGADADPVTETGIGWTLQDWTESPLGSDAGGASLGAYSTKGINTASTTTEDSIWNTNGTSDGIVATMFIMTLAM